MPKFKLSKLVRDEIVDDQVALGQIPHYRKLGPEEHRRELILKIIEEARELLDASAEESAGEIRDVRQALDDLMALEGITKKQIAEAQAAKNAKSGAFKKGIYVETLETAEDDPWTNYYRQDPERFPEVG